MTRVVAELAGLDMRFGEGAGAVHALDKVDLLVHEGEVLGLVGESGSGKSTLGRCLLRLLQPTGGRVALDGDDITDWPERRLRKLRARMSMVFQDPWSALNPRMSIRRLIEEPLKLHTQLGRAARRTEAERLAERVHLAAAQLDRTPAELSGGQLQRVCIARAIATRPSLIVLDEPTSSLDLSVRAGILDLLGELRAETAVSMVFITHDLATLRLIADRVAVLYLGRVLEEGPTEAVMDRPAHPYTQALLSAHLPADPRERPKRIRLEGEIPSPLDRITGCPFQTRCPLVEKQCRIGRPPLLSAGPGQTAACVRLIDGSNRIAA
ncbi:MAG: ABC transporter ATP-binding protein [Rhodospirillales bacterium]|nr:ABC transporter ATP-binding protein [Rhodospirillales bacterium]